MSLTSNCPNPGLVCRHVRSSGFKLALVVGYPTSKAAGQKLRVCFWRAASAKWTQPTLVQPGDLDMLVEADHMDGRRHALIAKASKRALDLKLVARVWS